MTVGLPLFSATSKGTACASSAASEGPPDNSRVAKNSATPAATAPPARPALLLLPPLLLPLLLVRDCGCVLLVFCVGAAAGVVVETSGPGCSLLVEFARMTERLGLCCVK